MLSEVLCGLLEIPVALLVPWASGIFYFLRTQRRRVSGSILASSKAQPNLSLSLKKL